MSPTLLYLTLSFAFTELNQLLLGDNSDKIYYSTINIKNVTTIPKTKKNKKNNNKGL